MIIPYLQAFLSEKYKSVYPYFVLLGLHEFSLGCFFIAHALRKKLGKLLPSFQAKLDGQKQQILIGIIVSAANIIFTVLEMHILVGKRFKQLKIDGASCSSKDGIAHLSIAMTTMTTTTTVKTAEMDG